MLIKIGKCCHPIPGDEVVGIVNTGKGIAIHTRDCIIAQQVMNSAPGKVVPVKFVPSGTLYETKVRVFIEDKPGMLAEVSSKIADTKTNITSAVTRTVSGKAILDFTVQVKDIKQLEKVLSSIRSVKGVLNVKRIKREKFRKFKVSQQG
jgi:GTP pyrophosphokinase